MTPRPRSLMTGISFNRRALLRSVLKLRKVALALTLFIVSANSLSAQSVVFDTNVGDIEVTLFGDAAPLTVANFLSYVNSDAYDDSVIHRSVPNFVVQGGGFQGDLSSIPTTAPVMNEPGISNLRGTIAMAKLGGQPDSATSQWFFNVVDNVGLDTTNGGFTVFGEVTSGLDIIDGINGLTRFNLNPTDPNTGQPNTTGPFAEFPAIEDTNNPGQIFPIRIQDVRVVAIPEPSTAIAMVALFVGFGVRRRRPA